MNYPTKVTCESARICGDIEKHPAEKDRLRTLKRAVETCEREYIKAPAELQSNIHIQEKSLDSKIRQELLFQFPLRYDGQVDCSYQRLSLDVDLIMKHYKRHRVTLVGASRDLQGLIHRLERKISSDQSASGSGHQKERVFQSAQNIARGIRTGRGSGANFGAIKRLWEEKNIKFTNPVLRSREPSSMEESDFYLALNLQVEEDKKKDAVDAPIELKDNNRK